MRSETTTNQRSSPPDWSVPTTVIHLNVLLADQSRHIEGVQDRNKLELNLSSKCQFAKKIFNLEIACPWINVKLECLVDFQLHMDVNPLRPSALVALHLLIIHPDAFVCTTKAHFDLEMPFKASTPSNSQRTNAASSSNPFTRMTILLVSMRHWKTWLSKNRRLPSVELELTSRMGLAREQFKLSPVGHCAS